MNLNPYGVPIMSFLFNFDINLFRMHKINCPYYPDSITCSFEQILYKAQYYESKLVISNLTKSSDLKICFLLVELQF